MIRIGEIIGAKELREALPWRYPMLLLDRVRRESETVFTGLKNLSINELFFQGHFPDRPIMPGVLQVEAMKQLCEIAVREKLDPDGSRNVYLKRLQKIKFRNPAEPGDRLRVEAEMTGLASDEASFQVKVSNAVGVTCEGSVTVGVRPYAAPDTMPAAGEGEYDRRSGTTAMEIEAIRRAMPHRYPFLLIDNVVSIDEKSAVAIKNLTVNEEVFCGSGGPAPVFPESLLCEIVAQVGCACILSQPQNTGKLGLFAAITSAESFAMVQPGDQLVCKVELPNPGKSFGKGNGTIYVDGEKVFEITLMFAIVDKNPEAAEK